MPLQDHNTLYSQDTPQSSTNKRTRYGGPAGLGSNTYLYLQIQIQIQIQRICICICIWSNFKPCICICIWIWSSIFGVFDKYVFKYTFFWAFSKHNFMEHKLTWIFLKNMSKSAILFQNKCRGLTLLIPIGDCACAFDLACQWVCDKPLAMPLEQVNVELLLTKHNHYIFHKMS